MNPWLIVLGAGAAFLLLKDDIFKADTTKRESPSKQSFEAPSGQPATSNGPDILSTVNSVAQFGVSLLDYLKPKGG